MATDSSPVHGEPSWIQVNKDNRIYWTRPALGSELLTDQFSIFLDGSSDCCQGITLRGQASLLEIQERIKHAYARLRFISPIIAATLETGIHDPQLRSWVYRPVSDVAELKAWVDESVITHPDPETADRFVAVAGQRKLPYILSGGDKQLVRCYIVQNPNGEYSIYLHGPHSILDARPTLAAFRAMLNWAGELSLGDLGALEWGTEWTNLPAGPVTATGGPRPDWEGKGLPLLMKMGELVRNPMPTLSIHPQRTRVTIRGKPVRPRITLDKATTQRIVTAVKTSGFSMTHLFEAAQALVIFDENDVSGDSIADAHVTYPQCIISLAKYRVTPYNTPKELISEMALVPIRIGYKEIQEAGSSDKDRLLAAMKSIKSQYDQYLENPHLPHLIAALMKLDPPRVPNFAWNAHGTFITNLGVIEQTLPSSFYPDGDFSKDALYEVVDVIISHRVIVDNPLTHVWTFASQITLQVESSDIWDEEYLKRYLDSIMRHALTLLD